MNIVFDIETDGLLDSLTKVHCMAYVDVDDPSETIRLAHGQHEITEIFKRTDIAIGHHIIGFDIPALEKVYGTSINCKLVDTYWLSSYLWYSRPRQGLAHWGEDFGIPKPKVDDWENLTIEEYDHRCTEDVKINLQLWKIILDRLSLLYKGDPDNLDRFVEYTTFKGQLANVPLIKLTATQMARTPNAFSTSPKTPELEVKTLYQVQELISRHRNIWGFQ